MPSSSSGLEQALDGAELVRGEGHALEVQVVAHVVFRAGAAERSYPEADQVCKEDLFRRGRVALRDGTQRRCAEHVAVGRERPEALVAQPMLAAKGADRPIVAGGTMKAV